MMQQKLALALTLLSYLSLCQAMSFINDDFFAYPRYKLHFTEKKIPESSIFSEQQSKNKQLGWLNLKGNRDNDPSKVIMMSGNAQPFLCTMPDISAQQNQHSSTKSGILSIQERQHIIKRGMELLKPLENDCLYFHTHGYWTYEYCHMLHVRQFHFDQNKAENGKLITDGKTSFILGKLPRQENSNTDVAGTAGDGSQPNHEQTTIETTRSPVTLQQIGDKQILVFQWEDGTPCDITNQPRGIDIQFQCAMQDNDQIVFFEEVSTCHYRMTIATPRLCNDLMVRSESHSIECSPVVPERGITDHEQQQQQQHLEQEQEQEQEQQQQQHDNDDTVKITIPIAEAAESASVTSSKQQGNDDNDSLINEQMQEGINDNKDIKTAHLVSMDKSELEGVISDLSKQVEQLKKSIDQQSSMDQLLLQQSQVVYMDDDGQLIWGGVDGSIDNIQQQQRQLAQSNNDAIQTLFDQLLWGSSSSLPPSSSQQQQQQSQQPQHQQQAFPIMDGSDAQQQNKKAYEKTYYSVD